MRGWLFSRCNVIHTFLSPLWEPPMPAKHSTPRGIFSIFHFEQIRQFSGRFDYFTQNSVFICLSTVMTITHGQSPPPTTTSQMHSTNTSVLYHVICSTRAREDLKVTLAWFHAYIYFVFNNKNSVLKLLGQKLYLNLCVIFQRLKASIFLRQKAIENSHFFSGRWRLFAFERSFANHKMCMNSKHSPLSNYRMHNTYSK